MAGDDDPSEDNRRRRGDGVHSRIVLTNPDRGIDLTSVPERLAPLTVLGVHFDEPSVEGALDDAFRARLRCVGAFYRNIGNASAGRSVGNVFIGNLGVKTPLLLPGGRINRDNDILGRAN